MSDEVRGAIIIGGTLGGAWLAHTFLRTVSPRAPFLTAAAGGAVGYIVAAAGT